MDIVSISSDGAVVELVQGELRFLARLCTEVDIGDQSQVLTVVALRGAFQALALAADVCDDLSAAAGSADLGHTPRTWRAYDAEEEDAHQHLTRLGRTAATPKGEDLRTRTEPGNL
jgi:Mg-chelatase subunit ChlI